MQNTTATLFDLLESIRDEAEEAYQKTGHDGFLAIRAWADEALGRKGKIYDDIIRHFLELLKGGDQRIQLAKGGLQGAYSGSLAWMRLICDEVLRGVPIAKEGKENGR